MYKQRFRNDIARAVVLTLLSVVMIGELILAIDYPVRPDDLWRVALHWIMVLAAYGSLMLVLNRWPDRPHGSEIACERHEKPQTWPRKECVNRDDGSWGW